MEAGVVMIRKTIGYTAGGIGLYLASIIFLPILKVKPQPIEKKVSGESKIVPENRESVNFEVKGMAVSGWFYKARNGSGESPCVVMSHGFSGTKDSGLERYALRFADEGYNVLTYDYRYYGDSQGMPRQMFCGKYQLDDLRGAVKYVKGRDDVDSKKIILWGTSAGAAYGVNMAAEDHDIAGVIAQCGAYDHKVDSKLYTDRVGYGFFLKLFIHGQRDKGRSRFGLSPHKFPAYGKPGTTAMITAPGAYEEISDMMSGSETFVNETCARLSLLPHAPNPVKSAEKVECPVQLLVCQNDTLVSPKSHVRLAAVLGKNAKVIEYPIGHFDIYRGEHFDKAVNDMIKFIESVV